MVEDSQRTRTGAPHARALPSLTTYAISLQTRGTIATRGRCYRREENDARAELNQKKPVRPKLRHCSGYIDRERFETLFCHQPRRTQQNVALSASSSDVRRLVRG